MGMPEMKPRQSARRSPDLETTLAGTARRLADSGII
jgi:hypothetical protein